MFKMLKKLKCIFSDKNLPWYGRISRWLDPEWYRYLFKPWKGFKVSWCRMRGHPCGVWFYNPSGLEPDMTCKNCGEDLG